MRSDRERAAFRARIHAYARSDVWKERSRRFRAKHPTCQACGIGGTLHAHHRTYARAFRGREPDRDLRALCPLCHQAVHRLARRGVPLDLATDRIIRDRRRRRRSWVRRLWRWLFSR